MRYFKKELIANKINLPNGKALEYTHVVNQTGVVVIDPAAQPDLLKALESIKGRMGVSEISEAQFEEFKKKLPTPERAAPEQTMRVFQMAKDPFANQARQPAPTITYPTPAPMAQPPQRPVEPAMVPVPVVPVEALSSAAPAKGPDESPSQRAEGHTPRKGKPSAAKAQRAKQ